MGILRALQSIRVPALDSLFSAVTLLGEETFFTVIGLLIFWCVDKKWGIRILLAGLAGTVLNQLLKAIFIVPRPWVLDPTFTIVERARAAATGYSFPSGHTQSAATVFGMIALWRKRPWVWAACTGAVLLVGFSRMYLGVHTPWDVGVSLATGIVTVACVNALMNRCEGTARGRLIVGGVMLALVLALLAVVLFVPVREGSIAEFDAHGVENAWKLLGTVVGFILIWYMDARGTHFPVRAVWWAQVIKCVLGVALVLAVRTGLKPLLNMLFPEKPFAHAIRYFAMAFVGGGLWPMTFGSFSRLGKQKG